MAEDTDFADLTEEEQVEMIEQTKNAFLTDEDEEFEQPPQDPTYVAEDAEDRA